MSVAPSAGRKKVRCSVYIAASIDGFIARPDGDVNWLDDPAYWTSETYGFSS